MQSAFSHAVTSATVAPPRFHLTVCKRPLPTPLHLHKIPRSRLNVVRKMPNELPQQFQTFLIFPSAKKTQDPPGQHQAKTTKNLHGGPGENTMDTPNTSTI